ncbi:sensor histidine kinase [Streptomyces alfalfae]|uniref:sensor histidine kinase n=1 Tax=Streptomyces alfalfae TaxID=1642299 RepID=UPI00281246AF|nr:ATP-binding protein [Streptomyces alfalfae]
MTAPTPLARPGTNGASPGPAQSGARASVPLRPSALVLLICALVTAALTATAVALAPSSARAPLAWGAGAAALALSVAVAAAFHGARTSALLRRQLVAAHQEMDRLAHEQARHAAEFGHEHTRLTERHAREVAALTAEHVRERNALTLRVRAAESERAAALAASANAAGRMQALATGMLADLREMEGRHADEDVLTDLLHLDHRTAQAGRIADSVAVLTGARSGRRWARPIVMESILRGAMGRIGGYQRVRVHSASELAVAGHAAEGVMHALAEILDNAANFSPPTSEVHVYIEEVAAGVIVSVEDSGLVMGPVQQRRAEQAVSGGTKGLSGLSGTRLGLAVVGRLARKHGLTVSFRPSARGGTGVLVLIPQELLTRPSQAAPGPAATPAAAPPRSATALPAAPAAPAAPAVSAAPAAGAGQSADAAQAAPAQAGGPSAPRSPSGPSNPSAPSAASSEDTAILTPVGREPLPVHESAAPPAAGRPAEAPLPKRPRGRTLAAAERARADGDTGETPRPRTADAATTAARFSSFRQAVRATPPSSDTDAPAPSPHPEGDSPR